MPPGAPPHHARQSAYGWVIVAAGLLISLSMYGVIESFAIMFKPIAAEFDWNRGTVSVASMVGWMSFGVSSLICGRLSDHYGSKWVIVVGCVLFVAGTFLMSQVRSLWHLYVYFGVVLAVGRSATGVPMVALVTKWFVRNQGLALALVQSQNVGSAVFAPLVVFLLAHNDWRWAYLWLGVVTLAVLPLAFLIRDKAADVAARERETPHPSTHSGTRGREQAATGSRSFSPPRAAAGSGMALGEAMRTRAFWTLNLMVLGCCVCHSCILLHGFNHMTDVGVLDSVAARVVMLMAVFGMVGKIANGLLADRIGAKWAIALFLGLQAVMIPVFIEARQAPSFYTWAVLFGLGFGGPMPVYAMLFREYFGVRAIGTILGVFFMVAAVGMGSGGLLGGALFNLFGSYSLPFLTSSGMGLLAAVLALTLPSNTPALPLPVPRVAVQTGG